MFPAGPISCSWPPVGRGVQLHRPLKSGHRRNEVDCHWLRAKPRVIWSPAALLATTSRPVASGRKQCVWQVEYIADGRVLDLLVRTNVLKPASQVLLLSSKVTLCTKSCTFPCKFTPAGWPPSRPRPGPPPRGGHGREGRRPAGDGGRGRGGRRPAGDGPR